MPPQPSAVCIPSSDAAFRAHVQVALDALGQHATPEQLQHEIAKAYPDASVHAKADLASFGSADRVFYAYRDSDARWQVSDRWWDDPTLPRTTLAADGRYLDGNEAALKLFGVDRARLLDSKAGDFTRNEGPHLTEPLFSTLQERGYLESTAVVRRPDGSEVRIAFRVIRDGAGPSRHVTVMRPKD